MHFVCLILTTGERATHQGDREGEAGRFAPASLESAGACVVAQAVCLPLRNAFLVIFLRLTGGGCFPSADLEPQRAVIIESPSLCRY